MLVSPRYLAGDSCGDTWGAWTARLRERGWTMLDNGADTTVLISPCLRVRCGWLPETSDYDIQFAASTHPLQALRWPRPATRSPARSSPQPGRRWRR
ncbi:hypothetical protein [Streptacidiphilus jiangxiensis]|uniref:Uncharacterized protein n=1 Tax=Streptacidiphilus jiangxiensis TaxID=235985 RepID=A0A1H8A577_STRJI|nr:hypothetical protein [Streptacidiphilus jiangxiensis]SEM66052.1 hypothetical protein SAMN05414137_14132 [Streptacidiphilus jiangxiensis]